MRLKSLPTAVACILLATACSRLAAMEAAAPLRLCHEDDESYPWIMKGRTGLTSSLLALAEKTYGGKIELVALPWKRCLLNARNGEIDGVVKTSYSTERTEFLVYPMSSEKLDLSRRLLDDSYSLYRLKDAKAATWDGKTLKVVGVVGAQSGFSIVDQLIALGAQVDDGSRSADVNLTKLVKGRVAAVALQTKEGDISISENAETRGKVERVTPALVEKPYFVAFSKQFYAKDKRSAQRLWDAIGVARESSEYKDLVKNFK